MALKLRRSQLSLGLLSLVHLAVGCGSLPGQLDVGAAAQFSSLQLDYIIVGGGPAGLALARRLVVHESLHLCFRQFTAAID